MPGPDGSLAPLADALRAAFADLIAREEVDVVAMEEDGEVEAQADTWTLNIAGWPPRTAWVALDDEGTSPETRVEVLTSAFDARAMAALRALDASLDGGLVSALRATGDDLSTTLAELIVAG